MLMPWDVTALEHRARTVGLDPTIYRRTRAGRALFEHELATEVGSREGKRWAKGVVFLREHRDDVVAKLVAMGVDPTIAQATV